MKKSLIVLAALAGLLMVGCSSNRGGADNQPQHPGYNSGTTGNPNSNLPPDSSGGPVRGPGTGGMGGTSTAPGGDNSGSGHSDTHTTPAPENNTNPDTAPSPPDNDSQPPQ